MFICVIADGEPFDAAFVEGERDRVMRAALGYDDECGTTYSAVVALTEEAGFAGLDRYELAFNIVRSRSDGSHLSTWWDGLRSRGVICRSEHRRLAMGVILAMIEELVDVLKPRELVWTTHEANLPDKALAKYEAIGHGLRERGFEGGRTDPYHGRWCWQFSLVTNEGRNPAA